MNRLLFSRSVSRRGRCGHKCYMNKLLCLFLLCAAFNNLSAQSHKSLLNYVDPLVGTASSTTTSATRHGENTEQRANTIPAVGIPFGMTQWVAQTRTSEQKCLPPYLYKDSLLNGFRGTHWLSGSCVPDYGSFTIMPITGTLRTRTADYAVPFSHKEETAKPDYYAVRLRNYHLKTEITATARCGMMQFTMEQADSLYLLIMPNSAKDQGSIRLNRRTNEVEGYNPAYRIYQGAGKPAGFSGYFVVQLQKLAANGGTFSDGTVYSADSIHKGKNIGAYLGFRLQKGETLLIRIGTSFTSLSAARKNLQAEIPQWSFAAVRQQAALQWEQALGKIQVTDSNSRNKHIFYTALFHSLQQPRLYNDVDGTYPMFAHQYETARVPAGKNYYDDFSMWDIYRAELPLLQLLQPQLINNLANSVITKGTQGGWLPIFPCWNSYTNAMIGDHTTAFLASTYLKGIKDYDINEAYRLMRQNAFDVAPDSAYKNGQGRRALPSYLKYGYVPLEDGVPDAFHRNEQVSRTLEYAYDDYALAMVAKALGRTDDYQQLLKRAGNYKNVFDPSTGLVRGRHADGSWITPFEPDKKTSYITEGTARQYSFYVPQDVPGLATLMGGQHKLEAALDSLFLKGEYWHGNEPGHQIPFLYNFTNAPWKTQRVVRTILEEEYTDGPGGLSGNDDAGQMSAWYVFAAMGLYPLDPVSGEYQLSAPLFDRVTVQLAGGKKLEIVVKKENASARYIKSMKLNGKAYNENFIKFWDIVKGCKIEIAFGEEADRR
jgi:predicted alpha-1,2-mannosidase